jgi:hypothetical protein
MSLVIKFEAGLRPVIKHQEHDQASHGSWATGTADPSLISIDTQIAFNQGAIKATDNILSPSAYKSQLDGNLNRTYPKTYLEEAVNNPAYQDALQTHLKSIGFPETVKVFSSSAQEGEYFHGSVAPLWDSGAVGYESEESPKEFSVNRSDIIGLGKVADSGVWFRNTKAVQKHQEHDQSSHGSWANSSERSAKEIEVQQRITDVKVGDFERDKYDDDDKNLYQKIEAKYKTKDGKTYLLSQENIKTPDGNNIIEVFSYEPKTLTSGKPSRKQIGSLGTEGRDSSIIDGVYVDEEHQRQGIATAMLNMARTYAPGNMKISHSYSLTDDAKGWSGVVKHQQGTHDQRTHGSWAGGGGAGVDISEALDEVFFKGKLNVKESKVFPGSLRIPTQAEMNRVGNNLETIDLIENMDFAETNSGKAYGDNALKIIAERQGFTGKPQTVKTVDDLVKMQSTDAGILVYRGITDYSSTGNNEVTYSAEQALTDFREGEYFGGWGVFGNGTYTTQRIDEAVSYSNTVDSDNGKLGRGKTMAMLIPKNAKAPSESIVKSVVKDMVYGGEPNHRNNIGRRLASMGYQYYDAGYVQDDKYGTYVILDRSMLTVAEKAVG